MYMVSFLANTSSSTSTSTSTRGQFMQKNSCKHFTQRQCKCFRTSSVLVFTIFSQVHYPIEPPVMAFWVKMAPENYEEGVGKSWEDGAKRPAQVFRQHCWVDTCASQSVCQISEETKTVVDLNWCQAPFKGVQRTISVVSCRFALLMIFWLEKNKSNS